MEQNSKSEEEGEKVYFCEICKDTWEISVNEQVYPGEVHFAELGTRRCVCQLPSEDDYQEED